MELQGGAEALKRKGINIAAVSYDPIGVTSDFANRRGITFPLLSDPGSVTIRRYGILNTTIPETNKQAYGIPFPGTFMLDAKGVVTARFFEEAYQERTTVGSILARIGDAAGVPVTTISSPQIEITTYATDGVAAPGTHLSLVIDVKPANGIHVYAPGVVGYKPIALSIAAQKWLIVRQAAYPKPSVYEFKPLNERVQVYQTPFRIVQDVALDASNDAQAALEDVQRLTIEGTLQYQACDDRVCFAPQSVPLTWTISVRQLDRERVKK